MEHPFIWLPTSLVLLETLSVWCKGVNLVRVRVDDSEYMDSGVNEEEEDLRCL